MYIEHPENSLMWAWPENLQTILLVNFISKNLPIWILMSQKFYKINAVMIYVSNVISAHLNCNFSMYVM